MGTLSPIIQVADFGITRTHDSRSGESLFERIVRMLTDQPVFIQNTLALHCRRGSEGCCDWCSAGGFPVPYPCIPARAAFRAREMREAHSPEHDVTSPAGKSHRL